MTEKFIVFVTCGGREEGERIAQSVVEEGLAACVNVVAGVRSCYVWEGKVTWEEEVLLVMKTTGERYGELESRIRELHSYDVPEVIAVPVARGLDQYLKWVEMRCEQYGDRPRIR